MRVCVVTDRPEHPLLAALPALLGTRHRVVVADPERGEAGAEAPWADLYLLKAHSPRALALARSAELSGGLVVNGAAATEVCQDRVRMAERARAAGLPFPGTQQCDRLAELTGLLAGLDATGLPLVVKSRASRRRDLVARLDGPDHLRELAAQWPDEPVVVQEFLPNDGWDHKLWVIGDQVFAGLRRSPLGGGGGRPEGTRRLDPARLPPGWLDLARAVGEAFDLRIYGVDLLATGHGPMVVDINPFPGCRGVPGPPEALAAFVLGCLARGAGGRPVAEAEAVRRGLVRGWPE